MGANGSYDKSLGGVPEGNRTHTDTGYRVDGHKVLLQTDENNQTSNILNSNSESPIYLMAKMYEDGSLAILNVNINKDHKIKMDINLKFDSQGNLIPYNGKESGSHAHEWHERPDGKMARKPVSKGENSHLPIPSEYSSLINHIVEFNKKKNHKK